MILTQNDFFAFKDRSQRQAKGFSIRSPMHGEKQLIIFRYVMYNAQSASILNINAINEMFFYKQLS